MSNGQLYLGIAVLVLGLLITVLFAAFLGYSLTSFYNVFRATTQSTQPIQTVALEPIFHVNLLETEGTSGINIDGPPVVEVGKPATFQVTRSDATSPDDADWSIKPPNAATVAPARSEAQIEAKQAGQFRIIAKVKERLDGKLTTSVASTTVQAKPREKGAEGPLLPFVGKGYVTLLALPLVLSVVALLGITGALTGEALAAVVSAIVGFLFGQVAASAGSGSQDSKQP